MTEHTSGGGRARARGLDLNSASERELAEATQIGPDRARSIVENRPFETWEDLKEIPGFNDRLIEDLKRTGFTIEAEDWETS
jgi:DNA uptake protein ComE-like DNA-binding protein